MDGAKFNSIGCSDRISGNGAAEKKKEAGNCPDTNTFAGYLDNKLAPTERDSVENHLADCPVCRNDFYEIRMLMDQGAKETPEALADSVKNNLQTHDGAPTPGRKIKI